MKIAVTPTVFIALGGTGTKVLQQLRTRLMERLGTSDLPHYRFLYVDTNLAECKAGEDNIPAHAKDWACSISLDPDLGAIKQAIGHQGETNHELARRLGLNDWWEPRFTRYLNQSSFDTGVGGKRMLSRLAFLANTNLDKLISFLDTSHTALSTLEASQESLPGLRPRYLEVKPVHIVNTPEGNRIRYVVVASAGGGTGSGSFIEMGYLIRRLRDERRWPNKTLLEGHVILAHDNGAATVQNVANTAAMLTELAHFSSGITPHQPNYLNATALTATRDTPIFEPPFDKGFCVMPCQNGRALDASPATALEIAISKVAEHLLAEAVTTFPEDAESFVGLDEFTDGPVGFRRDVDHFLMTFGIETREWPAALVHQYLYAIRIKKLHDSWMAVSDRAVLQSLKQAYEKLGIPTETVRESPGGGLVHALVNDVRQCDADRLCKQLLEARDASTNLAQWLEHCRSKAFSEGKFQGKQSDLDSVMNELKTVLDPDRGVIPNLVRDNATQMTKETPLAIAEDLLGLCGRSGPLSAAEAAVHLEAAVEHEIRRLDQSLSPDPSTSAPTKASSLYTCWEYANAHVLKHALKGKRDVLAAVHVMLKSLTLRFQNFGAYVKTWSATAPQPDLGKVSRYCCVPPVTIEKLERAVESLDLPPMGKALEKSVVLDDGTQRKGLLTQLREVIARGLPDRDSSGKSTLFAAGGPRNSGGKEDYSYLSLLESTVFQQIQESPETSPYGVHIAELLPVDGRYPDLKAAAEPLTHFTPDNDYRNARFERAATLFLEAVDPGQNGFEEFDRAQTSRWLTSWPHVTKTGKFTHGNPWTITYLCERGYIWPRLLTGYSVESLRTLCFAPADTPFTDSRIEIDPDKASLDQAAQCLLGALTLNLHVENINLNQPYYTWAYEDHDTGYTLTYLNPTREGHGARSTITVPTAYHKAVRALAKAEAARQLTYDLALDYARVNPGEGKERLSGLIETLDQQKSPNGDGKKEEYGTLVTPDLIYVPIHQGIQALYDFAERIGIRLDPVNHWVVFVNANDLIPKTQRPAPRAAYYCNGCGTEIGRNRPSFTRSCRHPQCINHA